MISHLRYAKALFELSKENSLIENWMLQMNEAESILSNEDVIELLDSPQVPEKVKFDGVKTLFTNIDLLIRNLVFLMIRNGDVGKFNLVIDEFNKLVDTHLGITRVQITTVEKISSQQINDIKQKLLEVFNVSKIEISEQFDNNIIGGIVIRVGDKVIDASSRTKIGNMKEFLIKGSV